MTFGAITEQKHIKKRTTAPKKAKSTVPDHIMVGKVRIGLVGKNDSEIVYQGWLNMAGTAEYGNVNVAIEPKTKKYNVWLDYGNRNTEKTVKLSGKLSALKQSELNMIGSRILKAYPYKKTMSTVVATQKSRRK